jgi:hypothetical protein
LRASAVGAAVALICILAGCGLGVRSPDLFVLTRHGQGRTLTMLVNDGGIIRCNRARAKALSGRLLIDARQLASDLDSDAKARLRIRPNRATVYTYTIKLQNGTISFPDTAATAHPELARAEQFALQAAHGPCA